MKVCTKCKIAKDETCFSKSKDSKDGYVSDCKLCRKEYRYKTYPLIKLRNRIYYEANKEKIAIVNKKWKTENKEIYAKKNKERRESNLELIKLKSAEYYANNKEAISVYRKQKRAENIDFYRERSRLSAKKHRVKSVEYNKNRRKVDFLYKLRCRMRKRCSQAFKVTYWIKKYKTEDLLGCSYMEAKIHLENQFKDGIHWNNYGPKGWHIDHIIPLSSAKTQEELRKLCHYTNLQPLWWRDNLIKHNKIIV